MKFSALAIKTKNFKKQLRGFNRDEVIIFLETVSDEYQKLVDENMELKNKIDELDSVIEEYKRIEKTLETTLSEAKESSTKTLEAARRQNQLLIEDAELKAGEILRNAKNEVEKLKHTVNTLKDEKSILIAKIKTIINNQVEILAFQSKISDENVLEEPDKKKETKINVDDIVEKLL